jgi:hypothetical protein
MLVILFIINSVCIYSLCRAAGRADKFEEAILSKRMNNKKEHS